jgi:hypothetical protein
MNTENEISKNKYTAIQVLDEPGFGNASHLYRVVHIDDANNVYPEYDAFAEIAFQKGPIKEYGINGCHNEDLISIVIDRLKSFQSGDYSNDFNKRAIDALELALSELDSRTKSRIDSGTEGTSNQ